MIEPSLAERLTTALVQASRSKAFEAALQSRDDYEPWRVLVEIALRDGRKTLAFVSDIPNERIPGFLEVNTELAQTIGKRVVLWVNPDHQVTKVYLEDAKIVDGRIYAADDLSAPR